MNEKVSSNFPKIAKEVDVVVAGGGPGGFASAIASSRNGASTMLLERYNCLGGMATIGLVGPFMRTEGANGGIFRELLGKMEAMGAVRIDEYSRYGFDSEVFKYAAQQMVRSSGVNVLFHTYVEGAFLEDNNIKGVIITNKGGRQVILAKTVIDASGDGDIAASAGADFEKGRKSDGGMQAVSLFFRMGGIDESKVPGGDFVAKALSRAREAGEINLPGYIGGFTGEKGSTVRNGEVSINIDTVTHIDGTDPDQLTSAELESRERVWECVIFCRRYIPGYENCFLMDTGAVIGVRETRRIFGEYVLTREDVLSARKFEDAITKASFFIDLHDPEMFTNPEWLKTHTVPKGDWYEIPYRCLVPRRVEYLLTCGRCISSDREANGSLRVMPTCMATGQAAGTAAAFAVKKKIKPRDIDGKWLREKLIEQGADLKR